MKTHSPLVSWSLIVGIVIVINLFFNYAISLVYETPRYEQFCEQEQVVVQPETQSSCVNQGGQWTEYPQRPTQALFDAQGNPIRSPDGYCDLQFTCRQEFETANESYQRTVFIALVVLGVIILLVGLFIANNVVLSTALAWGGVLSFVIASIRYWSTADNVVKVVILAIALALLIGVAVRKFKNS
jgi:hypothetical protein